MAMQEILLHPATWAILGIILKSVCPAVVPFLGQGRKLVKELTVLHSENKQPNNEIKKQAAELGLNLAAKWVEKQLD